MGKGREPLLLDVAPLFRNRVPVEVSMVFNRNTGHFEFHATYATNTLKGNPKPNTTVAVDMGEIHSIVAFDSHNVAIYNGRFHRALTQYREKFKAHINRLITKGVGNRPFYRWIENNYKPLFPNLPERTRLFRLFNTHHHLTDVFMANPSLIGVIDSELIHPCREGRSKQQIGQAYPTNDGLWEGNCVCWSTILD